VPVVLWRLLLSLVLLAALPALSEDRLSEEPDAAEPVTPTAFEAGASDPGASEPGAFEPGASDPGASEPGASEPDASEAGASEGGASEPGASDPGASDPDASDPGASDPGASDPGASEPRASEPGAFEPAPASSTGLLAAGSPGHSVLWYGPEWALIALVGAAEAFSLWDRVPVGPALLGPSFSLRDPSAATLQDPRLADQIGRPLLREKVPSWSVAIAGLGALGVAGLIDGVRHQDLHRTHSLVLGGLTAGAGTLLATQIAKVSFSRLRPDFKDRYQQSVCQGLTPGPKDAVVDCAGPASFSLKESDLVDGFRSFPSGHASVSFAFATYLSLWIGSEWVWGESRGDLAPALGTLAIGGLYASAAWVAATRLEDNRDHLGDVAVGAALGSAIAAASWLVHFDLDGKARSRGIEVGPGPGELGLSLVGRF
jgi:membrane-associated phospholipid phosphatase